MKKKVLLRRTGLIAMVLLAGVLAIPAASAAENKTDDVSAAAGVGFKYIAGDGYRKIEIYAGGEYRGSVYSWTAGDLGVYDENCDGVGPLGQTSDANGNYSSPVMYGDYNGCASGGGNHWPPPCKWFRAYWGGVYSHSIGCYSL